MTRAQIDAENSKFRKERMAEQREIIKELYDELAALRAENAKLRNGLKGLMVEMDRIWDEFEIGDELPRSLGRHILNSTTPDPLYAAAPEMLEVLQKISNTGGHLTNALLFEVRAVIKSATKPA